ncbi:MAG: hypothetical protein KI785_15850 [Devosiaceae bacterium]|nr:hypothetical protein [Devosiaceae bacterium MH13]
MSETDIVERLRNWETLYPEDADEIEGALYLKAAREIERLRKLVIKSSLTALVASRRVEKLLSNPASRDPDR